MHVIGLVILLLVVTAVFTRTVSRAREVHQSHAPGRTGTGPRLPRPGSGTVRFRSPGRPQRPRSPRPRGPGWLAHRRALAMERLKHRHVIIRDDLKHKRSLVSQWAAHNIRMRERQAQWDREDAVKTAPPPGAPRAGTADANPGASRPAAGTPKPATVPGSVVPDAGNPGPPPASPPSPQPEGTPVSTPGAVEPIVDGLHAVHARAAAGNIHAKHWAIKVCAELCTRLSALLLMTSRTLAERGYGPEISEPLARAGTMAQAASMACGESDTAITALKNMTVGDLADSPRQAPERGELSETGAY